MNIAPTSCVYGPVPSRRLGRSLGVDLIPFKICSYDCVYCQLGRTTTKAIERRNFLAVSEILACLNPHVNSPIRPDYLTLAGSGEPTLHRELGTIIESIKNITDIPLAVITNGSLLWDPRVRQELMLADVVLPSLDAGDEAAFHLVNRPHESLAFSRMVDGLTAFVQEFPGQTWLEIMLLDGLNSSESQILSLAKLVEHIQPERVQLNSVFRPGAESYATCLTHERLQTIADFFSGNVDIISEPLKNDGVVSAVSQEYGMEIIALLERRPCSMEDIATGLGLHPPEVLKSIDRLVHEKKVGTTLNGDTLFYTIRRS